MTNPTYFWLIDAITFLECHKCDRTNSEGWCCLKLLEQNDNQHIWVTSNTNSRHSDEAELTDFQLTNKLQTCPAFRAASAKLMASHREIKAANGTGRRQRCFSSIISFNRGQFLLFFRGYSVPLLFWFPPLATVHLKEICPWITEQERQKTRQVMQTHV